MATDDVTEHAMSCPCGKSTVTFTDSIPDHAWARESQRTYSAFIDCDDCRRDYAVHQEGYLGSNKQPIIVRREQLDQRAAAADRLKEREKEIAASPQAERLKTRIIEEVDGEPTIAATYRLLTEMRVSYETVGTYRRRPYGGAEVVRRLGGSGLARIGSMPRFGGDDRQYFVDAAEELAQLDDAEKSVRLVPVKLEPVRRAS
jgi:hypothetical protein